MSLLIHASIDDIHKMVCTKGFLTKMYLLKDKNEVKRIKDTESMKFKRRYTHDDIENIQQLPPNISSIIHTNLSSIEILMETIHEVLVRTADTLVIKYTSVLAEPEYVRNILGNTKIILYVRFSKNRNDENLSIVSFIKKIVNANDIDDDSAVIDSNNNDIVSNVFQDNVLKIDSNIVGFVEMFTGHDVMHTFILPTVNNIFNTTFDAIQEIYTKRFVKYVTKKKIEIYKKNV